MGRLRIRINWKQGFWSGKNHVSTTLFFYVFFLVLNFTFIIAFPFPLPLPFSFYSLLPLPPPFPFSHFPRAYICVLNQWLKILAARIHTGVSNSSGEEGDLVKIRAIIQNLRAGETQPEGRLYYVCRKMLEDGLEFWALIDIEDRLS